LLADFIFVTPAHTKPSLPSKDDLLVFIGQQSGKIGTREIARAFGLKNADRATLKRMLRELADEGRIERRRKKLHHPGTLPPVVLADITARDADGELIALPTEWDEAEHGPAPRIRVRIARHARPSEVAGVGDRALRRVERAATRTIRSATAGASSSSSTAPGSAFSAFTARRPAAAGGSRRSTRNSSARSFRFQWAPAQTPAMATWSRSRWRRAEAATGSPARA